MATLPPIPPNIAGIAGPILVALSLNWALYGVLGTQVYTYYESYPRDNRYIKFMVYLVFAIETAQTILYMESAFRMLAIGFGDLNALNQIGTLWLSVPFMDGLVAFILQVFYAYRIHVLASNKWISGFICFLATLQFGAAIATAITMSQAGQFTTMWTDGLFIENTLWKASAAFCDVVIAVTMSIVLASRDSGSVKTTHDLITRIIILTVETGTLTACVDIIALVLTYVPPNTTYYQAAVVILGKLYSNTLMLLLNIRPRTHSPNGVTLSNGLTSIQSTQGGVGEGGVGGGGASRRGSRMPQYTVSRDYSTARPMSVAFQHLHSRPVSAAMTAPTEEGDWDGDEDENEGADAAVVEEAREDDGNRILSPSISNTSDSNPSEKDAMRTSNEKSLV